MIYQLPNGKVIHLTLEEYLDLDEQDIQYLVSINAGFHAPVRNPWMGSAIEQPKEKNDDEEDEDEEETEESPQEDFPDIPEVPPEVGLDFNE